MKKFIEYSAFSGAFLACAGQSDAQIQYTDIDPDLHTDGANIFLDVDQDGLHDLKFLLLSDAFFDVAYSWVYAACLSPNIAIATNGLAGADHGVKKFESGEMIYSSSPWAVGGYFGFRMAGYSNLTYFDCSDPSVHPYGEFFNVNEKYLAFRTELDGNYHYGWVRLSVDYSDPCPLPLHDAFELTLHDFAIQLTPNAPLSAGDGIPAECPAPVPIAPLIADTYAKISWAPVEEAEYYTVQYRQAGMMPWNTKTFPATKTSKLIKDLLCDTNYEWRVKSVCSGGDIISEYSALQSFTTATCRLNDHIIVPGLNIYPNPANDIVYIDLDGIEFTTTITLLDLQGNQLVVSTGESNTIAQMNISYYPPGIYMINLENEQINHTIKIIKPGH